MDEVLKEALRLRQLGFAIHWLAPASKAPIAESWSTVPIMDEAALKRTYHAGLNLGFRPGKFSVVKDREICVLDIDIRGGAAFAEEAYAAAKSMLGGILRWHVVSGSEVGRHQYLGFPIGASPSKAATTLRESDIWVLPDGEFCAPRTEGARPAWQIELLSTGKNVVLPPSIHPDTRKPYTWATE
jgi:hypothetical protein